MDVPANILSFWRLVEWLTPASFPKVNSRRDEREPIYDIRPHESLPWDPDHPHTRHRCDPRESQGTADNAKESWVYGVYAGLLDINAARAELESWLDAEVSHVVRDEREPMGTSAIGFQVDGRGRVIDGTLVLSTFAWAYGQLRNQAAKGRKALTSDALSTEDFEALEQEVAERFSSELSGARLTRENCDEFMAWLFRRLSLPMDSLNKRRCRVQCVRRPWKGHRPASEALPRGDAKATTDGAGGEAEPADSRPSDRLTAALDMLNSHFLDDLALVQASARRGDIGPALAQYLGKRPPQQIDLRADHDEAWRLLAPTRFPRGRWPAKGRFPLVFSQQLAVNHAFQTIGGGSGGLMAINGPPGTGKTTLLKDVVAGIIVARAEALARYASPSDAFDRTVLAWESSGWRQQYAPLAPELQEFGIVVASSNNGAVENVTLEFPKAEDVDPDWGNRQHSPFTEIATAMLGDEDAWSLLSACLGKRQNRTAFADAFWGWERKDGEPGHARAPALLKGERPAGVLPWPEAVANFEDALDREHRQRESRQEVYESATRLGSLSRRLRTLQEREGALEEAIETARTRLAEARRAHEAAQASLDAALARIKRRREAALAEAESLLAVREKQNTAAREDRLEVRQRLDAHRRRAPGVLKRWFSDRIRALQSVAQWDSEMAVLSTLEAEHDALQAQYRQGHAHCLEEVARAQQALTSSALRMATEQEHHRHAATRQTLHSETTLFSQCQAQLASCRDNRAAVTTQLREAEARVASYRDTFGPQHGLTPEALSESPREKELAAPWADSQWEAARVEVFLAALDLHDAFVFGAGRPLQNNLRGMMQLLRGKAPVDIPRGVANTLWASLFLVVPVVSTTFASFARQFCHLGRESLGWLMIDEAGQAAPQQAAGALWRAKSALVVGDPLQLTPVVTVPDRLQASLAESVEVSTDWLPGMTSAQALADQASSHGSVIGKTWVGAPLLVHRRCDSPMFEISNAVAYDNAMVHGKPPSRVDLPPSGWIHVPTTRAQGHWIPAEGKAVEQLIHLLAMKGLETKDIFLISPFRAIVTQLRGIARRFPGIKAGTIHTVQGKEAKAVILVLGGDPCREGAKAWASSTPNLVNVAVSRAKQRLYVVANRHAWERYAYFDECSARLPTSDLPEPAALVS